MSDEDVPEDVPSDLSGLTTDDDETGTRAEDPQVLFPLVDAHFLNVSVFLGMSVCLGLRIERMFVGGRCHYSMLPTAFPHLFCASFSLSG